jgi:UDP-2,4-diacetamido-2,4,6-trideoxy-beta-L-altropyranose hydrolase/UDP-4-amino-4,6-dideoxy-N-acetyl-beta-L-altrosamine N-acetyltransferase
MKHIVIRADSSSEIGTGHIMRDLVLATRYPDAKIIFAVRDLPGNINHKIEEAGYAIELLESHVLDHLVDVVKKYDADMVIIDHYGIDETDEQKLKEKTGVTLMVLDDTYEKHYCDILLNHNVYADAAKYEALVPHGCRLLCGKEYTLLREEFLREKQKGRQNRNEPDHLEVLIAMGGTDHQNLTGSILRILEDFPNIFPHVVTTTANRHMEVLQAYTNTHPNVTLHINTHEIAKLMNRADLAIVTPSVTLNEICFLEVPFIAIQTAQNQSFMGVYLIQNNDPILPAFDSVKLKEMIRTITDDLSVELINFTRLTLDEKKMVLQWRNHPAVSKWMFTQDTIKLHEHLEYIETLKQRKDRVYFLVKKASHAIGVIDFTNIDHTAKSAALGVYADPAQKGMGNILMKAIIDHAANVLGIKVLISEVFEENIAAIKLYKRYNFKEVAIKRWHDKQVLQMELNIENR